jgi:hypothetical protein
MTEDLTRWLIGFACTLLGGVVGLLVASFRVGQVVGAIDSAKKELQECIVEMRAMRERLAALVILERAVEQLKDIVARHSSDIRELLAFKHRSEGRSGSWGDDADE